MIFDADIGGFFFWVASILCLHGSFSDELPE